MTTARWTRPQDGLPPMLPKAPIDACATSGPLLVQLRGGRQCVVVLEDWSDDNEPSAPKWYTDCREHWSLDDQVEAWTTLPAAYDPKIGASVANKVERAFPADAAPMRGVVSNYGRGISAQKLKVLPVDHAELFVVTNLVPADLSPGSSARAHLRERIGNWGGEVQVPAVLLRMALVEDAKIGFV